MNPNSREGKIIAAICAKAFGEGYRISVYDGGEWPVKRCTNAAMILRNCGHTEADTLRIRDAEGNFKGDIALIYGNAASELIADHTDNEAIRVVISEAEKLQDHYAAQGH